MSGIVGIYHRNGAPVNRALLESLCDFLAFRGPDAREIWVNGSVGFAHALLRTTHESKTERQPASLEGRFQIVADARLDARNELIAELQSAGQNVSTIAPDCDLILHAYAVWGTSCIDHLLGDFSFALWDSSARRMFCARDHFGVKPFYYAQLGAIFVFSNTLNCIRKHPAVSGKLNDLAIADFLLFDMIREPGATSFSDIHRLPPAHTLVCDPASVSLRRYWALPIKETQHYKKPCQCVEQFKELLDRAGVELPGAPTHEGGTVFFHRCGKREADVAEN